MMFVLLLILFLSLSVFIYTLLAIKFDVKKFQYRAYLRVVGQSQASKGAKNFNNSIKNILIRLIRISPDKVDKLKVTLDRCDIKLTPEEYYLKAITASLMVVLVAILFVLLGLSLGALSCLFLSVLVYFQQIQKGDKQLNSLNEEILEAIPGFIRSFSYGLESSRDIVAIIDKYRLVAKPALANELSILLANMKTDNQEEALRKFDQRLNLEPISTFVSGIIGIDRGIDYRTFFFILEENMKVLSKENLKREILKRPGKLRKSVVSIILALLFLYMVPIIIQVKSGFNIFN